MLVLIISVPVTDGGEKVVRVLYIHYPVRFHKKQVKALLDSSSEVNVMNLNYAWKLDFKIRKTNVGAQKIDGSALETFRMVIGDFQIEDKASRLRFFPEIFLIANTKFEMILGISFLKICNADILFGERTFTWKFYTTNKALPTTKQAQIVTQKKYVIVALDVDRKWVMVHMAIKEQEEMPVHYQKQAQVGALLFNEAFTEIPEKYSDYNNLFSAENAMELQENIRINKYAIKLEEGKQPPFGPIYSLGPIELETLKTYIEINLANSFIRSFKSPARALILSNRKLDGNLHLCVNYWGLNNITIKNQYPLPLVGKLLDWLGRARRFT